jgi:hypothetical protein
MRKHRKDEPAERTLAETTLGDALDLRSRGLKQRIVLHPRGARRHARHTAEARIDVTHKAGAARLAPIAAQFHQMDAPSRRIGFLSPQQISRTRGQTESAVHAIVEQISTGSRLM